MSNPPPQKPSQAPSIRLSIPKTGTGTATRPAPAPAAKRRRFSPVPLPPQTVNAEDVTLHHQTSCLNFVLNQTVASGESAWHCQGETSLYLSVDESTAKRPTLLSVALHLRGSCQVSDVSVECMGPSLSLKRLKSTFQHNDPLEHVLIKPPTSYTEREIHFAAASSSTYKFDADAQSSRGAAGMTTALRAASIASNMGELRIAVQEALPPPSVAAAWKKEFLHAADGSAVQRLRSQLQSRDNRDARITKVARDLAARKQALKVTVKYRIPLQHVTHLAGLHALVVTKSPHVYTTAGVYGDHEGPRSWLPCLDSAASKHRSSHELTIQVTAPFRQGISCVGMGQSFGCQEALLHDLLSSAPTASIEMAQKELGVDHVRMLQDIGKKKRAMSSHAVIPSEEMTTSIDDIQVTSIWCSNTWTPIPVRSLGFAIGPFKILEDPEYFGPTTFETNNNDDDDESPEDRLEAFFANARENGEGIRQAHFASWPERKFLHQDANAVLLPNSCFQLVPLTSQQKDHIKAVDETITYSTVGVPHRALQMMRHVLALPTYRTASYTQVWIPNAVHGGCTSGGLHLCPEVLINPFLGGAIMDSRLLPPVGSRLPFYQGGRVLQFLQARNAIRGWITAAVPLGGQDDVGMGYILSLIESLTMSLYERGHGAQGEGGAKGSVFYSKRYAANSGLNSPNLDFLPIQNIEDVDAVLDGVGAVPVEERRNDQLWRSAINGTESHTGAADEFNVRHLLNMDALEALERGTDKDKLVPTPSMGWFGSHLSLSFLSSNASSSSDLGCGAVELLHPVGGLVYRKIKCDALRGVVEGRAGLANFVRLLRAAFIASHLDDIGETQLKLPSRREKKSEKSTTAKESSTAHDGSSGLAPQPFVVCVNEILKKKGLTHTLFTRALRNLSGRINESNLLGTLVDVERHAEDPRTRRPFVDPEGFPNSYVRASSMFYCRVGVQVEAARDVSAKDQGSVVPAKGIQMQAYAEPIIPEGGIAFGGPVTIRVVENEGQFREYVKELTADGSRRDWGTTFLHAKPVTTGKAQTAASGTLEGKDSKAGSTMASSVFTESQFHSGGYQAIELIRLTNLTPLLWVRVDPLGQYGGRISVFQPDACLAEQLFHDGDAMAQVDAIRSLAERPLRIQGSTKATAIYDVNVSELPVRVLGDCLRGSPALHSSLPHTPAVRIQAALAIAQWQNNKAPSSKDALGADSWVGINLLLQYFRERFFSNSTVMPVKFSRLVLKKSEAEVRQTPSGSENTSAAKPTYDDMYQYLDALAEGEDRASALEDAEEVELEEDEECRVRSAVVAAIASIRAKDGLTPTASIQFLETLLESQDAEMVGHLVYPEEELMAEKNMEKIKFEEREGSSTAAASTETGPDDRAYPSLSYVSSSLVADALLALSYINARPAVITDPATGKQIQTSGVHPLSRLIKAARSWLDWELYRERIRSELASEESTGISGNCYDMIAACATLSLANLVILKQSTISPIVAAGDKKEGGKPEPAEELASLKFYVQLFDSKPLRNDLTRAAAAQAAACICCAADRIEKENKPAVGLLTALEFLLDRILDKQTSPSLRHTLSLIMMDACTGKVCSMQRVGAIAGRNELTTCAARFMGGPLGASHGGDNGSAMVVAVSAGSFPAANAVNNGARRGLRLLSRAGHPRETIGEKLVVRVALFATRLWRTINGEPADPPDTTVPGLPVVGVCAYDGVLRTSLLALWQWIWPRGCYAVLQVQAWKSHEGTQRYRDLGAHLVMKITDDEKAAAAAEENALSEINHLLNMELDRQSWRGEMVKKAYDMSKFNKKSTTVDIAALEQGIGQPLPPIQRDTAFKQGGWIASAAQQRRALALDGGTAVTKLRLKVKSSSDA